RLAALEKPWWPIHSTRLRNCLDKIRTVDLPQRGPTDRRSIVLLITDAYPISLASHTIFWDWSDLK
uniref:Uncharacterized protein n=1 Tax=Romanomermis culicivorax TaxID=13658 RepID=A0A915IUM2_ROMCU